MPVSGRARAPEWLAIPDSLRRADGESVYTAQRHPVRHGRAAAMEGGSSIALATGANPVPSLPTSPGCSAPTGPPRAQLEPAHLLTTTVTGCGLHLTRLPPRSRS